MAHRARLCRCAARSKLALLFASLSGVAGLGACRDASEPQLRAVPRAASVEPSRALPSAASSVEQRLPPLHGEWLERVGEGPAEVVLMPPLGAVEPRRLVIGVHGAGDRSDWACGGWRLGSKVSAIVACPRGQRLGASTYAWSSAAAIESGVDHAVDVARARFGPYIDAGPLIFAAFSQGATLAEPVLRKHAARFPIAILAEGGYRTTRDPAFAAAYRAAGGRRVVLVCGTASCFRGAPSAQRVLERAGLEVQLVGDPRAGHNLNQEMQRALQAAWPRIVAPLP